MSLIFFYMCVGADTIMTPKQDICVKDCRHNHTNHNQNPAALLLHHSHATNTHPATAAANT
jgi:hypothetical protein